MNIFQINSRIEQLVYEITEAEGVISEQQETELAIAREELHDKVISYSKVILHKKAEESTIKEEIKRLQDLLKQNIKVQEVLENRVINAISEYNAGEAITSPTVKISLRKSQSIEIPNESDFIASAIDYCTEKTTIAPNKKAIKEAIQSGINFEGLAYIQTNQSLQIK